MELTQELLRATLVACDMSQNGADPVSDLMPNTQAWSDSIAGWTVDKRIDDPVTGFGATVFRKAAGNGKFEYIVALQGTRGPNAVDWNDNLSYGWRKFISGTGGLALIDYLTNASTARNNPGILDTTHQITFTGQSLGGALAQYAAYRYVDKRIEDGSPIDLANLSLTTFNGLGGLTGLQTNYGNSPTDPDVNKRGFGKDFVHSLLAGAATAYFWVNNDFVNQLGGGNLNGNPAASGGRCETGLRRDHQRPRPDRGP